MVENLKRFREPAAWIVLVIIVAGLVLSAVRLADRVMRERVPTTQAFQDAANNALNLTMVIVLVALVCVCLYVGSPSPRAKSLALASAWVVTIGVLLTIVATVWGLSASAGAVGVVLEALGGLLAVVLKGMGAITLWIIYRASAAGRLVDPEPEPSPAEAPEPAPPVGRPSAAAGSVWKTAADAASGGAPSASGGAPELTSRSDDDDETGARRAVESSPSPSAQPDPGASSGVRRSRPQVRDGAAEALGWRRVTPEDGDTSQKSRDS